jgi:hypothetical protein
MSSQILVNSATFVRIILKRMTAQALVGSTKKYELGLEHFNKSLITSLCLKAEDENS